MQAAIWCNIGFLMHKLLFERDVKNPLNRFVLHVHLCEHCIFARAACYFDKKFETIARAGCYFVQHRVFNAQATIWTRLWIWVKLFISACAGSYFVWREKEKGRGTTNMNEKETEWSGCQWRVLKVGANMNEREREWEAGASGGYSKRVRTSNL